MIRVVVGVLLSAVILAGCTDVLDGHPVTGSAPRSGSADPFAAKGLPDFTRGVVVGSGSIEVVDYDDLQCPACATLQPGLSAVVSRELARRGALPLRRSQLPRRRR